MYVEKLTLQIIKDKLEINDLGKLGNSNEKERNWVLTSCHTQN